MFSRLWEALRSRFHLPAVLRLVLVAVRGPDRGTAASQAGSTRLLSGAGHGGTNRHRQYTLVNRGKRTGARSRLAFFPLARSMQSADAETTLASCGRDRRCGRRPLEAQPARAVHVAQPFAYSTFPSICGATAARKPSSDGARVSSFPSARLPGRANRHPVSAGRIALTSNSASRRSTSATGIRAGRCGARIDHRSWARLARPVVPNTRRSTTAAWRWCWTRSSRPAQGGPGGIRRSGSGRQPVGCGGRRAVARRVPDRSVRGRPELYVFRAGRHTAHFENILEIVPASKLAAGTRSRRSRRRWPTS